MCVCARAHVCVFVCVRVGVSVCTEETDERVHYFTPTKSVSDLYSMHEEEYCNTHYTNSSWRKKREGQRGRGGKGRGEGWEG